MLDITDKRLSSVIAILRKLVPDCEVWAYGSRINGSGHAGSDLDLVILGKDKITWQLMAKLKSAFEDSNLPFSVDVLDWNGIPDNFKENIRKKYEVMQKGTAAPI
jgi:predicted nucleotidyltransferase